jgi:hypothetical protein
LFQKIDLVLCKPLRLFDFLDDDSREPSGIRPTAMPCARDRPVHIEPFDRFMKVAHESTTPQLAIRENL